MAAAIDMEDALVGNRAPDDLLDDASQDAASETIDDAILDDAAFAHGTIHHNTCSSNVAPDDPRNDDAMDGSTIAESSRPFTSVGPPPALGNAIACGTSRKRTRRSKEKRHEAAKKAAKGVIKPALLLRHLEAAAGGHQTSFTTDAMPHTKTSYQGLRTRGAAKRVYGLEELVGKDSKLGMELKKWDGKYVAPICYHMYYANPFDVYRVPIPILDEPSRAFCVCIGQPRDDQWPAVASQASAAISTARTKFAFPASSIDHRRGAFPAAAVGVSFGGGQQVSPVHPCSRLN